MKPISLQLYSLREQAKDDFVGVLKAVADMGYVGVEPAGMQGMSPADVRKVLDDLQLVCSSTHGPFPSSETISQRVDEAGALGTDMIISGLGRKAFETPDASKASVDKLAEAASLVVGAGMKFGYHNHWWEFDEVDGRTPYDLIMAEVPEMFSELDVYWAANFGAVDVPAVVTKYASRIPLLHVKDGPLVRDEPHTAVGAGKMDIPAIIAAADPDVLGWLIVELDDCGTDMAQAVRESCAYLVGEGLGRGSK
ncbi:hypothetical protein LCGC14_1481370 [marine sediment metagenome]|uniref:Xylose isomerase-like TIM barrel domain-containing protein n=1 Tax=marine sediment metagenome TaxID=412755 RepID=A0A0F9MB96_9ZZZZ